MRKSMDKKFQQAAEEYQTALTLKPKKPDDVKVKLARAQLRLPARKTRPRPPSRKSSRQTRTIPRARRSSRRWSKARAGERARTARRRSSLTQLSRVIQPCSRQSPFSRWGHRSASRPIQARRHATAPPNVVLIIADDMGYRDYGFMGHRQIQHAPARPPGAPEPDLSPRLRDQQPLLPQPGEHPDRAVSPPAQDHQQ